MGGGKGASTLGVAQITTDETKTVTDLADIVPVHVVGLVQQRLHIVLILQVNLPNQMGKLILPPVAS